MKANLSISVATLIALCLVTTSASAAGERAAAAKSGNERIIGGITVTPGDGPWAVRLNITKSDGDFICGASLVSPKINTDKTISWEGNIGDARWLITAAHCLYDEKINGYVKPENVRAITGRLDLKDASVGEERKVIAIIPHKDYVTNTDHDIALMVMNENQVSLSKTRRKSIRLPTTSDGGWINNPYLALITQGWGKTDETGGTSQELLEVRVPLVDRATCESQYGVFGYSIPGRQICAGFRSGGFDSCGGDSGGPLLYRPATDTTALISGNLSKDEVLIGAVSWGVGCGRQDLFGVYTSISRYSGWLNSSVNKCLNETPTIEQCS